MQENIFRINGIINGSRSHCGGVGRQDRRWPDIRVRTHQVARESEPRRRPADHDAQRGRRRGAEQQLRGLPRGHRQLPRAARSRLEGLLTGRLSESGPEGHRPRAASCGCARPALR